MGSSLFGEKLHWNHLIRLGLKNWPLEEAPVREFWSTLLVTSRILIDVGCLFISLPAGLDSSARQASSPKGAGTCVSSQLIRWLCWRARLKRVLHRHLLIPQIRKETVI